MDKIHLMLSNSVNRKNFSGHFNWLKIGKEAVIKLDEDPFRKKSLKKLVARGKKQGKVEEIFFREETKSKLEAFKLETTHGKSPQLTNLFQSDFTQSNRLFVLTSIENKWLAALMLSGGEKREIQTELLLRSRKAKTGAMEALIFEIFRTLKEEEYLLWSLGAVPFIKTENFRFTKDFFYNFLGRRIKFAFNYKGLFHFKNKFNPLWRDYYLLTTNKINLSFLLKAAVDTNLFSLLIYKLKYPFRNLLLKEN